MALDAVTLARSQFAWTIMFHYLFPPLSIGLGVLLVIMEGLYLKTKDPLYEAMTKFWVKIFALNFSMGVATGIVMEFQFGTNWATYSRLVGDVFGALLASEGIFAFFLESGFLAVLLFGWNRVSPKVHFFATCMVAFGATFSAFWINIANSWQQIPVGYKLVKHAGIYRAEVSDFWAIVFGPNAIERFTHAVLGGWIQAAFFVLSISAFYIIKNRHLEFAKRSFIIALIMAALVTPLQALVGSRQGEIVAEHQPAKLAAFEAHYHTARRVPLYLIGLPDERNHVVRFGIPIPGLVSFLAKRDFNAKIQGLLDFPKADRPPVTVPFFAFRSMVFVGMGLILLSWVGLFLFWKKTLFQKTWLMWVFVFSVIGPYIANQAGWVAAEVGRQPWIVYGILRTKDAASTVVTGNNIIFSLVMFTAIYLLLFLIFIYSLDKKIRHGHELVPVTAHPRHGQVQEWMELAGERNDPADKTNIIDED